MIARRIGVAAACAVLLACAAPPRAAMSGPSAGEVAVVRVGQRPQIAELRVRGRPVLRLSGTTASFRLQRAAAQLEPLLPSPTIIQTRATRNAADLLVDGRVVLSVTRADARRLGATPGSLVGRWAAALEEALAIPPLTISKTALILSPGRTEAVSVTSAGFAPVEVGAFDQRIIGVRLEAGEARITGRAEGSTLVPIRHGPYRVTLAVSVKPPAGRIPESAEVVVTGMPAPPLLIEEALARRLQEVVQRDPGAVMEHTWAAADSPLQPGGSVTIPVDVRVRSPYGGPVDGTVSVKVTNQPVRLSDPELLLISNRPEKITDNGLLFQETLAPGRGARLLYHHVNGTPGQARILKITLHNPGATAARVHYISGLGGPSGDSIFIGFVSTQRFLSALLGSQGYLVDVPPGGAATFTAYRLPPLALVSGLMQFQVVEGGPIDLIVRVRLPYLLDQTVMNDLGPSAFPHPRGTFPKSSVEVVRESPVHTSSAVADLGVMANLRDIRTGESPVGDYGVLYRLRVRLVNPTDREASTALMAQAAGGAARGLFYVDGAPLDVGLIRATEDREVAAFTVGPRSARDVTVLTMPVAGSFYPVRLVLRPR